MSMTLRDLVARGTPLEWFESVAVAQELCADVVANAGAGGPRVPDLPGVEVGEDGRVVAIDAGGGDQAPVFRLAHLLNVLLAGCTPPVPLRLLVLTALSPEPTYKSLPELSQALEYFERPDRREVIRAVYERAAQLPAIESAVPSIPEKPPAPDAAPALTPPRPPRFRRKHLLVAGSLAAVLALAGAGSWASRQPASTRLLTGTRQVVSRAVSSAVDVVRERLGGSASAAAVEAPPSVAERPSPPPRAAKRPFTRPLRARQLRAAHALPSPVALPASSDGDSWTGTAGKYDEVVYLNLSPTGMAAEERAYSASDTDVRPPLAVRPMLPTDPPPGVSRDSLTRFEVLVSASGDVESVKIVAGPRTALDGMMLSAVKAWKFQPATKDGRPVAYRHQVWLTTATR